MGDGFVRRYDGIGIRDGFEGWAVYYYSMEDGKMRIYADRAGIERNKGENKLKAHSNAVFRK